MKYAEGLKDFYTILRRHVLAHVRVCPCFAVISNCSSRVPYLCRLHHTRQGLFVNRPLVVYYDHACALNDYCMARDPWLFRNVVFVIDKFHLKNHTCSCSYAYYEISSCFAERTQVAEQGTCT